MIGGTTKGKRFSEALIIPILHEAASLDNVHEVCRQHNIGELTLYRWHRQVGGLELFEAKWLRVLKRENAALKRLIAHIPPPSDGDPRIFPGAFFARTANPHQCYVVIT